MLGFLQKISLKNILISSHLLKNVSQILEKYKWAAKMNTSHSWAVHVAADQSDVRICGLCVIGENVTMKMMHHKLLWLVLTDLAGGVTQFKLPNPRLSALYLIYLDLDISLSNRKHMKKETQTILSLIVINYVLLVIVQYYLLRTLPWLFSKVFKPQFNITLADDCLINNCFNPIFPLFLSAKPILIVQW